MNIVTELSVEKFSNSKDQHVASANGWFLITNESICEEFHD